MNVDDIKDLFARYIKVIYRKGKRHVSYHPETIWDRLTAENKHDLIHTLRCIERKDQGYHTIILPKEGFSNNPETHKAVLAFLKKHDVNFFSVEQEIHLLESALHEK